MQHKGGIPWHKHLQTLCKLALHPPLSSLVLHHTTHNREEVNQLLEELGGALWPLKEKENYNLTIYALPCNMSIWTKCKQATWALPWPLFLNIHQYFKGRWQGVLPKDIHKSYKILLKDRTMCSKYRHHSMSKATNIWQNMPSIQIRQDTFLTNVSTQMPPKLICSPKSSVELERVILASIVILNHMWNGYCKACIT